MSQRQDACETPHVSYVFDGGFALPSLMSAYSLLSHRPKDVVVEFFVTEEIAKMQPALAVLRATFPKAELRETLVVLPDTVEQDLQGYPIAGFSRLLLPHLLDRKTIYLDGDTWVRDDIGKLFHADLQGRALGACLDAAFLKTYWRAQRKPGLKHRRLVELGALASYAPPQGYVNAGMLVIDIPALHAQGLVPTFTDIARATTFWSDNGFLYHDQSFLNALFGEHMARVDPRWNAIWANRSGAHRAIPADIRAGFDASRADPAVLHMTSKPKPWLRPVLRPGKITWARRYRKDMNEFKSLIGDAAWAALSGQT